MKPLKSWIPRLTIGTALLHFGYAAYSDGGTWFDMLREGLFNTVADQDAMDAADRHGALWFLAAGVGVLALGTTARSAANSTGHLPRQLGVYMLAIGTLVTLVEPVSGGPLVVLLGLLALAGARSRDAHTSAA